MIKRQFFLSSSTGTCWAPLQGPACAQLLLGGAGFHLQVLRSCSGGSLPQGHPSGRQDQLDVQASDEAPGNAWPHLGRQKIARSWQGTQIHPHDRWLEEGSLEAPQQPVAPKKALSIVTSANCFLSLKERIKTKRDVHCLCSVRFLFNCFKMKNIFG